MADREPFDCKEAFRRLDDYLDRELAADELTRVKDHLAVCEVCAREFRFDDAVLKGVRESVARIQAPPGLLDAIRRRLAAEPPPDES
jgi:anti-sigma factor (TIGR02949 family)